MESENVYGKDDKYVALEADPEAASAAAQRHHQDR